jgi:phosphoenolpyruvate carboxylase
MKKASAQSLPPALKSLVHHSVRLFGEVLKREVGPSFFMQIENLRESMAGLRGASTENSFRHLQKTYVTLRRLPPEKRLVMARSFTLMLEVMNACENAYRTSKLHKQIPVTAQTTSLDRVTYVLTAHPTEARSPDNIAVFHQIQNLLIEVLEENQDSDKPIWSSQKEKELQHLFEIAWRTWIVRHRAPKVKDEAEHIYSMLFRKEVFAELLELTSEDVPLRLHTWVGGDKDGHPGVQERTLLESLTLSRRQIVELALQQLQIVRETLELIHSGFKKSSTKINWQKQLSLLEKDYRRLRKLLPGDGARVTATKVRLKSLSKSYREQIGEIHPALQRLEQIGRIFPGYVVPLELRESSDVLMSEPKTPLAIDRMLARVSRLSRGGDPQWYAHGFIISMAESIDHIRRAADKQMNAFGRLALPIVPLFEEVGSLQESPAIIREVVNDRRLKAAAKKYWGGKIEMMVGYSDSSKEAGVLFSRLSIAEALPALEKVCKQADLIPVFFHGSGGSVDRGGGSVQDQTAWWPRSALRNYKVTIQGEMVERTFATREIARGQIETILRSAERGMKNKTIATRSPELDQFARRVQSCYSSQIKSSDFLKIVEKATPYSFLRLLKMGSRPAKRSQQLEVSGLRAIPWILCWTQTRVLFPTWWGLGTAWAEATAKEKQILKKDFRDHPVFTSYVKALGFTLAKTELAIWRMYLEQSTLPKEEATSAYKQFATEWNKTVRFFKEVSGQKSFTWEKPWLGESIVLRSPMIHPLNILQILAKQELDVNLLRVTATGISSGMLTTG